MVYERQITVDIIYILRPSRNVLWNDGYDVYLTLLSSLLVFDAFPAMYNTRRLHMKPW